MTILDHSHTFPASGGISNCGKPLPKGGDFDGLGKQVMWPARKGNFDGLGKQSEPHFELENFWNGNLMDYISRSCDIPEMIFDDYVSRSCDLPKKENLMG